MKNQSINQSVKKQKIKIQKIERIETNMVIYRILD